MEPTSSEPTSLPEHELAPKVPGGDNFEESRRQRRPSPARNRTDNDEVKSESNHQQPLVMVVASDSEIDLDEVLVLRLSAVAPNAQDDVKARISIDFPSDGKLVRGGNPSSIGDDGKADTNNVTMSHAGNKPLDLVLRFAKPGKKPITIAVEAMGQTTTATFNVLVDKDEDEKHEDDKHEASKEKKSSSSASQKKESHKKK